MRARYLYDLSAHAADRAAGRPHWPAYTPLMLEPIGLAASPISPEALADEPWESETAVLFLTGPVNPDVARLRVWVEGGGILVAWSAPDEAAGNPWSASIDDLLGVRGSGPALQQSGDFEVGAQIALLGHPLTEGVASPLAPDELLLAFSSARVLTPIVAEPVARLLHADGTATDGAAITARLLGRGRAFCFAFDLAKSLRVLHHGRPVDPGSRRRWDAADERCRGHPGVQSASPLRGRAAVSAAESAGAASPPTGRCAAAGRGCAGGAALLLWWG